MTTTWGGIPILGTGLCLGSFAIAELAVFTAFVHFVTHRGDFYRRRRWKGSAWMSVIMGALILFTFQVVTWLTILYLWLIRSGQTPVVEIIKSSSPFSILVTGLTAVGMLMFAMVMLLIPFLFISTIGMYMQFHMGMLREGILERFWKDPDPFHRSPFEEL